jgi:hypothetical protein
MRERREKRGKGKRERGGEERRGGRGRVKSG